MKRLPQKIQALLLALRSLGIFMLSELCLIVLIHLHAPSLLDLGEYVCAFVLPIVLLPFLYNFERNSQITQATTAQLAEEHALLATLIEALPDAIFLKDIDGHIVNTNSAGAALFDIDPSSLNKQALISQLNQTPALQESDLLNSANDEQAWMMNSRYDFSEVIDLKDGQSKYIDVTKIPLFNQDKTRKGILIIGRDVSFNISALEALKSSEERWKFALESTQDGVWDRDLENDIIYFSERSRAIFGLNKHEHAITYAVWRKRVHKDDVSRVSLAIKEHLAGKTSYYREEYRIKHSNGSWIWVLTRGRVIKRNSRGKATRMIGTHTDISARKQDESELRLAASVFENNTESIIICTAPDNIIVRVNRTFTEMTGYSAEEAIGKNPRFLSAMDQPMEYYQSLWNSVLEEGEWQGELLSRRKNGEVYPGWLVVSTIKNEQGEVTNYMSMLADISERKKAENRIHNLAYFDTLTGLPNRPMLDEHLKMALANAERYKTRIALMFIDLDNFKTVNDSLGHLAGDKLLKSTAMRVSACLREGDTLARLGGDEFVILLPNLPDNDQACMRAASRVVEKIHNAMSTPFNLDGFEAVVTPSIGVATYPTDANNAVDLVRNADAAMYHAKSSGRNNHQFYAAEMNLAAIRRLTMDAELRKALRNNEFILHYQPQINLHGEMIATEVLLRWNNANIDFLSPTQFIPLAEETGLIVPIGDWIINHACAQMKKWLDNPDFKHLQHICINISPRQFAIPQFVEHIQSIVDSHNIPYSKIELELTEGILMKDTLDTLRKLNALKILGFKISVDDFGTGYSSLAYLHNFPIDVLKIDQSFIRAISEDQSDSAISRAIIMVAKSLDMHVIAEGVETYQQLAFLRDSGCELFQGFYFGKPMNANKLEMHIKETPVASMQNHRLFN